MNDDDIPVDLPATQHEMPVPREPEDHRVGPEGGEFVAPKYEIRDNSDGLSPDSLARKRATADELIEALHRIGARSPDNDPSGRIIINRLMVWFRRYDDVVMLAERRYRRIATYIPETAGEQRLVWMNRLDDAWLTWKSAWDIYSDVSEVLRHKIAIQGPPDKPGG